MGNGRASRLLSHRLIVIDKLRIETTIKINKTTGEKLKLKS
jgi:hypothetical protein